MGSQYYINETNISIDLKKTEQKCLFITLSLNIALSIFEVAFFFVTYRSSILFDGIFSSIMSLTSLFALILTFFIKKKSFNYPFGKSIYDNVFAMFKNLLLAVVSVYFIIDSSISIRNACMNIFDETGTADWLYIIYICVACGTSIIITLVFYFFSRKINHQSIILKVEIKSSIFDFLISFFIGIALLVSAFTSNSILVRELVDKCLTILFIIIILPIVVKSFFQELLIICGYRVWRSEEQKLIEHLDMKEIIDIYIRRHNQQKIFMIKLNIDNVKNITKTKHAITNHIYKHYSKDSEIYFIL